jgi:threonine/homoserine/homoserine lactone efflux protein
MEYGRVPRRCCNIQRTDIQTRHPGIPAQPQDRHILLAFLLQFVVAGAGPAWAQLLLHGSLIIVVAGFVEPPLILVGSKLAKAIRNNPKPGLWLDRSSGSLFIALGLKLALSEK